MVCAGQEGEITLRLEMCCRTYTEMGEDEVLLLGKQCCMVPGSRTMTAARYRVQEEVVIVAADSVRRRCEHCPHEAGTILVLRLRDPMG